MNTETNRGPEIVSENGSYIAVRRAGRWYRAFRENGRYATRAVNGMRLVGPLDYVCSTGAMTWCCETAALDAGPCACETVRP